MLNWIFKKRADGRLRMAPAPASAPAPAAPQVDPAEAAAAKARQAEALAAQWQPQLQAALGDDAALLRLAQDAPVLDIKLAAVQGLAEEAALKQAERHFRDHDRRVHRAAKQRLEAAVQQREARAKAAQLIATAQELAAQQPIPVNRLVALDQGWAALNAPVLLPEQREQFASLRAGLDTQVQQHAEQQAALQRWSAQANQLLAGCEGAQGQLAQAAQQGAADDLAALLAPLRALIDARPASPATALLDQRLRHAAQAAAQLQAWLRWLQAEPPAEGAEQDAAQPPAIDDTTLARLAAQRLAQRQAEQAAARRQSAQAAAVAAQAEQAANAAPAEGGAGPEGAQPGSAAPAGRKDKPAKGQLPRPSPEQQAQVADLVQQAETALADGDAAAMQQHLNAADAALKGAAAAALPAGLRNRLQALHAERARLNAWRRWGGTRAREDLLAEAEALARLVQPEAPAAAAPEPAAAPVPDPAVAATPEQADAATPAPADESAPADRAAAAPAEAAPDTPMPAPTAAAERAGARPRPRARLNLKAHADAIHALRQRWKELDHADHVTLHSLWHRFDKALTIAFQPVAAAQAELKAQRQQNLAQREALLAALEAVPAPGEANAENDSTTAGDGAAAAEAAARPGSWKDLLSTLDRFHHAWRQLGPAQHTVPHGALNALMKRHDAAVARLEAPLQAVRAQAAARREQLIAQAQALVPTEGAAAPRQVRDANDAAHRVRDLQAAWAEQARALPLARNVERALWDRFKAATDAVFAQRTALFNARDAERQARDAERQAHEAERRAREAAAQAAAQVAQQRWQQQCAQLAQAVALCQQREDAAGCVDEALAVAWAGQREAEPALPVAWQQALQARWEAPAQPGPLKEAAVNESLLHLEAALNVPPTPEQQDARRQLKLLAMKAALESRSAAAGAPQKPHQHLQVLLRQAGLPASQRQRLAVLLQALGEARPLAGV
jgi:hypothetical protein